jgi:hypothetical protein
VGRDASAGRWGWRRALPPAAARLPPALGATARRERGDSGASGGGREAIERREEVRDGTIARALAPWGESGVRVGVRADVARL